VDRSHRHIELRTPASLYKVMSWGKSRGRVDRQPGSLHCVLDADTLSRRPLSDSWQGDDEDDLEFREDGDNRTLCKNTNKRLHTTLVVSTLLLNLLR
jgi:hypothetical protein